MIRQHSLRRFVASFALVPILATTACGSDSAGDSGSSEVTIKFGQQSGIAERLLKEAGQDKDLSYTLEFVNFDSGPLTVQALQTGVIDFGTSAGVVNLNGDDAFKIVLGGSGYEEATAVVAGKDSGIETVSDLKGKKIGVVTGASDYVVYSLLEQAGLSKDDVEIKGFDPSAGLAAFTAGQIDAWSIWYPFASRGIEVGGKVIADGGDFPESGSFFGGASDAALADDDKATALADVVKRLSTAQNWANANPDEWAPAYADLQQLDLKAAKSALTRLKLQYAPIDATVIAGQQKIYDFFLAQGLVENELDVSEAFDERFNDDVAKP